MAPPTEIYHMRDVPNAYAQSEMLGLESYFRERAMSQGRLTQFHVIARNIASSDEVGVMLNRLEKDTWGRNGEILEFVKAAQAANTLDGVWGTAAGRSLSQAFLASIAEGSLLEQLLRFGIQIPEKVVRVMTASGAVADVLEEGDPKPVKHLDTSGLTPTRKKAAAMVVLTQELQRDTSKAAGELFKQELTNAVLSAVNAGVLAQFPNVINVPSTGTALGDLTAGLAASEPSTGYVVAADPAAVRELALQADGRMGVNGGEFVPGVVLVPVPSGSDGWMRIIPASRVGVIDEGLVIRESTQGSVMMSDTPTSPGQLVSLWQTNSIGILVERSFALLHDVAIVEVG